MDKYKKQESLDDLLKFGFTPKDIYDLGQIRAFESIKKDYVPPRY